MICEIKSKQGLSLHQLFRFQWLGQCLRQPRTADQLRRNTTCLGFDGDLDVLLVFAVVERPSESLVDGS